ncbi:uncharacterized protein LOC119676573 [Teleopsis dalmanni]|uniref:uncharacterized protein LOC119676573 n=1 Tax=Teleopsis dalmanni TaxID=139649 RepID=UPI0018CEEA40|nr:uncharacterized protein LOC119676573 [Teleopsis dalmanni]
MRGLIILCLASLAVAAPQGYNYAHQQDVLPTSSGITSNLNGVAQTSQNFDAVQQQIDAFVNANNGEQFIPTAPAAVQQQISPAGIPTAPQARYLAPAVVAANALQAPAVYQQQQNQIAEKSAEALVTKRFFIHSAPEEEEEARSEKTITVGQARKNYNVVFIKAPSRAAQRTSVKIRPAANEERTVIYVLAKKHDSSEVDAQVIEPATTTSKPEVYFIKYKTSEEAAHAQQTIQAQYDNLGGSTFISNEGVSPVTSVIGSLDAVKHAAAATEVDQPEPEYVAAAQNSLQSQQQQQQLQQAEAVAPVQNQYSQPINNAYLPPSRYFH